MRIRIFYFFIALLFTATFSFANEYHVSKKGDDENDGSLKRPFNTISKAVYYAYPGDTITIHTGVYREWVNPIRGGESDINRIVYRAAPGEKVEIKGSEIISGWEKVRKGVWKVTLPNSFFGEYNPYSDSINGDWFYDLGRIHHTGEVFLNGKSLYEKESLDKVLNPIINNALLDPEGSTYTWYCESDPIKTTIWANFHKFNPNKELIEISTRKTCFYPEKPGINFITISGFHISQAATQWGAPTAEQIGMIATHWNKGWIIENNIISDSKCSGITLGKERGTGHNVWTEDIGSINNDGNIHYIEVTFRVLRNGWNKENIGSHIIRNNQIFNCEQTGICGSMGAAFSTIENNHIYNIHTKKQFNGAEIGGIKFHAPIDATIRKNKIHDCTRGLWLDWMTQGTRVTGNLFYRNKSEDLFLEVNHGPYVIDNNILLSDIAIRNQSQGGAFAYNLIAGRVLTYPEPNRFTPYFLPHSTDMAGLTTIKAGDDRFYNNIFVGKGDSQVNKDDKYSYGLGLYDNSELPVWMEGNVYYNEAQPCKQDTHFINIQEYNPEIKLFEDDEQVFLNFHFENAFYNHKVNMISSEILGEALIPNARFENPDGSSLKIIVDYFGNKRLEENNYAGPFLNLNPGEVEIKVW